MEVTLREAAEIMRELYNGYSSNMKTLAWRAGCNPDVAQIAAQLAHDDAHPMLNNLDDDHITALYNFGDALIAVGKALQLPLKAMRG
jgi:hypothetical protein